MKNGVRPGTEMRLQYLRTCLEKGLPLSTIAQETMAFRGKSEKEKEELAETLMKKL